MFRSDSLQPHYFQSIKEDKSFGNRNSIKWRLNQNVLPEMQRARLSECKQVVFQSIPCCCNAVPRSRRSGIHRHIHTELLTYIFELRCSRFHSLLLPVARIQVNLWRRENSPRRLLLKHQFVFFTFLGVQFCFADGRCSRWNDFDIQFIDLFQVTIFK
jgi:hypothetical protein